MSDAMNEYDRMRIDRGWPTPNHMRRTADALDILTPARYGDVLRWFADLCDAAPVEAPRPVDELGEARFAAAMRTALDRAIAVIDEPQRYAAVSRNYRAGWVDALTAVRDDPALAANQSA